MLDAPSPHPAFDRAADSVRTCASLWLIPLGSVVIMAVRDSWVGPQYRSMSDGADSGFCCGIVFLVPLALAFRSVRGVRAGRTFDMRSQAVGLLVACVFLALAVSGLTIAWTGPTNYSGSPYDFVRSKLVFAFISVVLLLAAVVITLGRLTQAFKVAKASSSRGFPVELVDPPKEPF